MGNDERGKKGPRERDVSFRVVPARGNKPVVARRLCERGPTGRTRRFCSSRRLSRAPPPPPGGNQLNKYPAPDRAGKHSTTGVCHRNRTARHTTSPNEPHARTTSRPSFAAQDPPGREAHTVSGAVFSGIHASSNLAPPTSRGARTPEHRIAGKNKSTMNKLSIFVILTVAVCSTYGISDRRSIRSVSEVSDDTNPIATDIASHQDSVVAESADVFTARGKGNKGGGHKNKMEAMHMGLSYIKMVLSTLMAAIGHVFAFKSVGLSLISVLIQIAQFVMVLKKNKESHPPSYKIVETPWHTSPTESYGSYGSYAGHAKSADGGYAAPYTARSSSRSARRRR